MFSGTTSQTTRATLTTSPLTKASQKLALGCALTAAGEAFLTSQVFAKIILAPSKLVFSCFKPDDDRLARRRLFGRRKSRLHWLVDRVGVLAPFYCIEQLYILQINTTWQKLTWREFIYFQKSSSSSSNDDFSWTDFSETETITKNELTGDRLRRWHRWARRESRKLTWRDLSRGDSASHFWSFRFFFYFDQKNF